MKSKLARALEAAIYGAAFVGSIPAMAATVTLSGGTTSCTYSTYSADASGNLTINCVNAGGPGTLQFSPSSVNVTEGGSVNVTVTRTGGSTGAVSATWTRSGGTATAGNDYTDPGTGEVSFADGETASKIIQLVTTDDQETESTETVVFTLSSATGGATLGAATTATANIQDNDGPGTLQFAPSTYNVTEGGSANITVTRTGGAVGAVSATWTRTAGTATAGSDYTDPGTGVVQFADGDAAAKTITLNTTDDATTENTETVVFALSGVQGATLGTSAATVSIVDNDAPQLPTGCVEKSINWPSGLSFATTPLQTMNTGQMFAFKMDGYPTHGTGFPSRAKTATGMSYSTVKKYFSISETPCDFSPALERSYCAGSAKDNNPLIWTVSNATLAGVCNLTPGRTYYFNVKNAATYNGSETCPVGKNCTYNLYW